VVREGNRRIRDGRGNIGGVMGCSQVDERECIRLRKE